MKFVPRQYQIDTVNAWWQHRDKNSIIAVPTGAGKTVIMGMFIKKYLSSYPYNRVVVLSHTREILTQDFDALTTILPDIDIGLYSSGLGMKDSRQVTIAGIQTAYRNPKEFEWTNLYIVDECHTVNTKQSGMYRTLLREDHPSMKLGMSATVYRTGHGFIHQGGGLFDKLAYDLTSVNSFNKLVEDGYLTKLISKTTHIGMNTESIKEVAGDYSKSQLSATFDRSKITKDIVNELIVYGKNYKKWLVFAIDTKHADRICHRLQNLDIKADVLHSKIGSDRTTVLNTFKSGDTRALVSVGMVTTGFDSPAVDLIALLRPTKSAVLHVQMVGRGLRVHPNKDHCLVLDFAGNTQRLGPINDVIIPKPKGAPKGDGEPVVKTCPKCMAILPAACRRCDVCNYEFKPKVDLTTTPSSLDIVAKNPSKKVKWLPVANVKYSKNCKKGGIPYLLVTYTCGLTSIKEYICLNHTGYPKHRATKWIATRLDGNETISNVDDALKHCDRFKVPSKILVDFTTHYPIILNTII